MKARLRKDSSHPCLFYFFFYFFFIFFFAGSWVGLDIFTLGVVELPGLLPGNTGIQWEMSNYGENKPVWPFLYNSRESNIHIIICLFKL